MKLGKKTLFIITISLLLLTLTLSLLASTQILGSFAAYEGQEIHEDVERAVHVLDDDIKEIGRLVRDWAYWDNVYDYIADPDIAFMQENMSSDIGIGEGGTYFGEIKMSIIIFIDSSGTIVFGRNYNEATQTLEAVPQELAAILTLDHPILQHPDILKGNKGFITYGDTILMVCSRPILTTDGQGPPRGTLIMGRYLNYSRLEGFSRSTNLSLTIARVDDPNMPPDMQEASHTLHAQSNERFTTRIINDTTIAGYALLRDMQNNPAFVIRTDSPRTIYAQGQTSVSYLIISFIIGVLIIGGIMMITLQTVVVSRLSRMSKRVRQISINNDLTTRLSERGNDELTMLAEDINKMLTIIAQSQEDLRIRETEACEARNTAEQANQMKSQFLANMSHELRTPLNAIINFTRIIAAGMRGPVTDEQLDYLNRVRASGEHLLGLINDILDLSKIEAGRMELYLEQCSISELVRSTMSTAIGLTKEKPIEIVQDIALNLSPVQADRTRLRQILLNLLSNAAKFTDEGSITVKVWQRDEEICISVADTGVGIPAEKLSIIFEEFQQAEGGTDRSYEGTGLGLAICKRLVTMHGGRIWVESMPGKGSTFTFTLPSATAGLPEAAVFRRNPSNQEGIPILVVDDDAETIDIIGSYLEQDGYRVYGITDSRYALCEVRRLQPAVIITDILMPYKDGWELLTELKAEPDLQPIPVLLYSVMDENWLGLQLGASAYLTKPIEESLLRTTMKRLITDGARVLVIDDDPNVREMVQEVLTHEGSYTVVAAAGGQEGLDRIASIPPDLIILDLMMPEVDGFTVLERLEDHPLTQAIPVIVLTAKDLSKEERDYLTKRVNSCLAKEGTSPEHLTEKVKSLLGNNSHVQY